MYKPLTPAEAKVVVSMLCPGDSPPTSDELDAAKVHLDSWRTASVQLKLAEPHSVDLRLLRAMFAAELTNHDGPREQMLDRILSRHEVLLSQVRVSSVLFHLPTLAVYRDKTRPATRKPPSGGIHELNKIIDRGLRHKA